MKYRNVVKIDEVGRLVIPKEMRKLLNLDQKLVSVKVDGSALVIRGYAPVYRHKTLVKNLCDKVSKLTGYTCFAGDENCITYVSDGKFAFLEGKKLSGDFLAKLKGESAFVCNCSDGCKPLSVLRMQNTSFKSLLIMPVKNQTFTTVGFFALLSDNESAKFTEREIYSLALAKELFLITIENCDK